METIQPRLRAMGVRSEDKVIFLDDGAINSSLVLLGNRGWTSFGSDVMSPGKIEELIAKGARYLMFTRGEWLDDVRLAGYLDQPVGQVENVRVFDLRAGGSGVPGMVVFDQNLDRPTGLKHRLDTASCGAGAGTWCFEAGTYPFEIDAMPTYGPGTAGAVGDGASVGLGDAVGSGEALGLSVGLTVGLGEAAQSGLSAPRSRGVTAKTPTPSAATAPTAATARPARRVVRRRSPRRRTS